MSEAPDSSQNRNGPSWLMVAAGGGVMLLVIIGLVVFIVTSHDNKSGGAPTVLPSLNLNGSAPPEFSASEDAAFLQEVQIDAVTDRGLSRIASASLIQDGHSL